MKVEFTFDNKRHKFDAGDVLIFLKKLLAQVSTPFPVEIESVTNMSRWLLILIDFPTLTKHERTLYTGRREENWWETIAGYLALQYDVVFLGWEVHGEDESLIYKKNWRKMKSGQGPV